MNNKFIYLVLVVFLAINIQTIFAKKPQEIKELGVFFEKYNVAGSILIFDQKNKEYIAYNLERCNIGFLPASTFKILNSLIALETGTISADTIFKWNGDNRGIASWEKDLSLEEAFKVSCVPVYQDIARHIGTEKMIEYIKLLNYGDMNISEENIDKFWLEGKSKITQFEQIYFLTKLYNNELPLSEVTTRKVKEIMFFSQEGKYRLSGKTGLAARVNPVRGWFVGYVELDDNVIFFATNIEPLKDKEPLDFGSSRVSITKDVLRYLNIIK